MSIDINDEIVQDFLVEAGEILEQLDGQLVLLETKPDDVELLNAVFRNFHTIKGGAGFLAIEPLVDICHQAEIDVLVLRRGEQSISTELMDCILLSFDAIHSMFEQIGDGSMPGVADAGLIDRLKQFADPGAKSGTAQSKPAAKKAPAKKATPAPEKEPAKSRQRKKPRKMKSPRPSSRHCWTSCMARENR